MKIACKNARSAMLSAYLAGNIIEQEYPEWNQKTDKKYMETFLGKYTNLKINIDIVPYFKTHKNLFFNIFHCHIYDHFTYKNNTFMLSNTFLMSISNVAYLSQH